MEPLTDQFDGALQRIEISGTKLDRAIAAHKEVREILEGDETLAAWGIDTVLIGSYARRTGIYPGNDVDVFAKLNELDTTSTPSIVFERVRDVLVHAYGPRAVAQRRSVKIEFAADGFSVDAVPAVRSGDRWAIPSDDAELWSMAGGAAWVETDPERLAKLTTAQNRTPTVGGRGAYVPTVKLMRQARSHHLGDMKPGGLFVEIATYWAFEAGPVGETFAECFSSALRYLADHLAGAASLLDPALSRPITPLLDAADRQSAGVVYATLAAKAEQALASEKCPAAALWREILGTNDRGSVFPLPAGCDEQGRTIASVTPNVATGRDEARGFG